ncbi:MAG: hypothetical protein WAR21_00305 [Candidatus Acidiferrales bacterium]
MKIEKRLPGPDGLVNIAAKAGQLAYQASGEPEAYRLAGRLFRLLEIPVSDLQGQEVAAFAQAYVHHAKAGNDVFSGDPHHFLLLQCAVAQVSYPLWEQLWNDKHPDRFGQGWEGEDFALMSVWREKVRATIRECRQYAVFAMPCEEYVAKLIDAGASEEAVEMLVDWMSNVLYESEKGCEDEAGSSAEVERG